ncbi:F-box protein SKIP22-like [Corylus avellana]|uniref:F-box protein SKIP22-like n=1 Tax=Corylus avellana TaxID=13451 RepID=UPI001E2120CF|nr:F-box protein SKIP22-like [Corylus avellana]
MATMKLRIRSLESKQTLKVEIPTPSTLQQLKQTLSQSISSSSSIYLSLNRKDELHASSPEASLQSLGITSGDLIFFTLNPTGFSSSSQILAPNPDSVQQPPQTLAPNFPNLENPSEIPRESQTLEGIPSNQDTPGTLEFSGAETMGVDHGSGVLNSENEGTLEFSGAETMGVDDGPVSMVKKFSERCFLGRVLSKELGDYGGDHTLLVIAVHAVFLESGFVGFDSVSGMRVDRFHLADEWPSRAFTMSLWYTLPELLGNGYRNSGNMVESVVLKFQSLGHSVAIYGSLAKGGPCVYRACLNENRFVPAISLACSDSVDSINEENGYPESEIFEFWKMVKDGLVLPLLIDLCEKANLLPPPCFIRLPADLKLKILESLPGVDLARVGCVCSELQYLSSNNELWKRKCDEEFELESGAQGLDQWKGRFASLWEKKKKRKRDVKRLKRFLGGNFLIQESPFGAFMGGRDHALIPGRPVASAFGPYRRIQRVNFRADCHLGGFNF